MKRLTESDFVELRFGMLVARRMFRSGYVAKVECACDCGTVKIVNGSDLRRGGVKSCGCLRRTTFNKTFTKHGNAKNGQRTKEYRAWRGMVSRCSGNYSRKYYIEKGVTVSPEWVDNFPAFLAHVGLSPSALHTLDRIDNSQGYRPGNVRWATPQEQARNRSNGVYVTIDGERMLLVVAAEKYSIDAKTVRNRIAKGWQEESAIKTSASPAQHTATRPVERRS